VICHFFFCLRIYDNLVFNKQVQSQIRCQLYPLIRDRHGFLPFETNLAKMKFMAKRFLIHIFKQTRTKYPVNLYSCPNDSFRNIILVHFFFLCVPLRSLRLCVES